MKVLYFPMATLFIVLIVYQLNQKKYVEAIKNFDKTISLRHKNAKAYYYRGIAYFLTGEKELALDDLNKSCDLKFEDACDRLTELSQLNND